MQKGRGRTTRSPALIFTLELLTVLIGAPAWKDPACPSLVLKEYGSIFFVGDGSGPGFCLVVLAWHEDKVHL